MPKLQSNKGFAYIKGIPNLDMKVPTPVENTLIYLPLTIPLICIDM